MTLCNSEEGVDKDSEMENETFFHSFIFNCSVFLESHSTRAVVLKLLFSFVNACMHVWHSCCVQACHALALFAYFDVFFWLGSKEEKWCKLNMEIITSHFCQTPMRSCDIRAPPHPCVLSEFFVSQISWEKCEHAYIYAKSCHFKFSSFMLSDTDEAWFSIKPNQLEYIFTYSCSARTSSKFPHEAR